MRCPILEIGWMQTKVGDKGQSSDCLKEECAWWDGELKDCLIMTVAVGLTGICGLLMKLVTKMSHVGQFKK